MKAGARRRELEGLQSALPGVLILGAEYQGLGLLRQLQPSGIRCALIDQDSLGVARLSRYRCPFHNSPRYESEEFWAWLTRLASKHGYTGWLLIPTDDEQVRQIALHHEEASRIFRYAGPTWSEYQVIYDKRLAYEWCGQRGVPVPTSFVPQSRSDDPDDLLAYPFIVKPAFKRNFSKYTKAKALRVDGPGELSRLLGGPLRQVPIEDLIYQEIIAGDGTYQWSYAGLFVKGEPLEAFTACRRRQHPPDFGRASTYVSAMHDASVERESLRVLRALNYTGLAEVEWKRDPKSGQLKFLEINARCWGWQSLSSKVVGNLPMKLYQFLVSGEKGTPASPDYGWQWVKYITDVPVALDLWRRGDLTVAEYLRSLRGNVISCEWARDDPLPFFLQLFLVPYLAIKRGY